MVVPHKRTRSDVLLTRSPLAIREQALHAAVRLACVRHAASVQSEPGSNSSLESCFLVVLKSLAETDWDKSQSFLWLKVWVLPIFLRFHEETAFFRSTHTYRFVCFRFLKSICCRFVGDKVAYITQPFFVLQVRRKFFCFLSALRLRLNGEGCALCRLF